MSQLKEDIREAFPNARNIVDEGDGIRLTLPNGATVKVEFQDKISISPEQAAKTRREHGIRDEMDITVNGYTLIGAKKAFIALAHSQTAVFLLHLGGCLRLYAILLIILERLLSIMILRYMKFSSALKAVKYGEIKRQKQDLTIC